MKLAVLFILILQVISPVCYSESILTNEGSVNALLSLTFNDNDKGWEWKRGFSEVSDNDELLATSTFYKNFVLSRDFHDEKPNDYCISQQSPDKKLLCSGSDCLCACFLELVNDFNEQEIVPGKLELNNQNQVCCLHDTCYSDFYYGSYNGAIDKETALFAPKISYKIVGGEKNTGVSSKATAAGLLAFSLVVFAYNIGYIDDIVNYLDGSQGLLEEFEEHWMHGDS